MIYPLILSNKQYFIFKLCYNGVIRKWVCHMKVEIWSDFVCPFCFLGKRHLELALEKFSHKDNVIVKFKSFQLNDPEEALEGLPVKKVLSQKYQTPENQIDKMNEQLRKQGQDVGITLNFENLLHISTFNVHRLVKYAETVGLAEPLITKLFEAYFTHNKNINDSSTLLTLAEDIGMQSTKATEVIETCKFRNAVKEDIDLAEEMNVQGVPFFVLNEKYALTGAQPVETLLQALETVWQEEGDRFSKEKSKTEYCCGDDCKNG